MYINLFTTVLLYLFIVGPFLLAFVKCVSYALQCINLVRGLLEKDFGATIASVDLPKMTLRNIIELTSQSANKKGEKDTSSTATTGVQLSSAG